MTSFDILTRKEQKELILHVLESLNVELESKHIEKLSLCELIEIYKQELGKKTRYYI